MSAEKAIIVSTYSGRGDARRVPQLLPGQLVANGTSTISELKTHPAALMKFSVNSP